MLVTWESVLTVCGIIASVVAALKGLEYIKQKSLTYQHGNEIVNINRKLDIDKRRLDDMTQRLSAIENAQDQNVEQLRQSISVVGQSLITICQHMAQGNHSEELLKESQNLSKYFMGVKD